MNSAVERKDLSKVLLTSCSRFDLKKHSNSSNTVEQLLAHQKGLPKKCNAGFWWGWGAGLLFTQRFS